jgi:hypothetical protein
MDSIFRNDIFTQETSFFLRNTFILPSYLNDHYNIDLKDVKKIINDIKETSSVQQNSGNLSLSESLITESFMKRCFSKCKKFVLEDWVDYDELDCTMRCTLLHKKSFNLMKEVHKNI